MIYVADPRGGDYINGPQEWQQAVCREVRDLVHSVDRQLAEALAAMFRQIIANNLAGGWRVLKREG